MALGKGQQIVRAQQGAATQLVKAQPLPADIAFATDRAVDDFADRTPATPLIPFQFVGDLLEVRFEDYYDSRGMKIVVRVDEANVQELKPGKDYVQIYYYNHPTIPQMILEKHGALRNRLLADLAPLVGLEGKPNSAVLQELNSRVEPLEGIKIRYTRTLTGTTRNGRPKLDDDFELIKESA
jgi:hypothetical protein